MATTLIALVASPAGAQTRPAAPPPAAADKGRLSVFADFSILRDVKFGDYDPKMPGFAAGAILKHSDHLSLIGEFGINQHSIAEGFGNTKFSWSHTSIMGGARYYYTWSAHPKIRPMGQLLLGIRHTNNGWGNSFTLQPGIGVAYPISGKIDFETHIDYRNLNHQWRFMSGVVFPLNVK